MGGPNYSSTRKEQPKIASIMGSSKIGSTSTTKNLKK